MPGARGPGVPSAILPSAGVASKFRMFDRDPIAGAASLAPGGAPTGGNPAQTGQSPAEGAPRLPSSQAGVPSADNLQSQGPWSTMVSDAPIYQQRQPLVVGAQTTPNSPEGFWRDRPDMRKFSETGKPARAGVDSLI